MDLVPTLQQILRTLGFEGNAAAYVAVFGLAMARLITAVSLAPFMGGKGVPSQVKIGVSGAFVVLLFPIIEPSVATPMPVILWVALLVKEVLIGALLGFLSQLVFLAIQMAGTVIDTQRGMNQFSFFAPQLQGNTSALGLLQFQAALVVFLAIDGHLIFVQELAESFVGVPVTQFPAINANGELMLDQLARLGANTLVIAVKIAAPVLIALFLIDACFGALNKIAPQAPVHGESSTVKSFVGLVIVFLGLPLMIEQFGVSMIDMMAAIRDVVGIISGV